MNDDTSGLWSECAELMHRVPVALAVLDAQGRVLEANEALCQMLGYSHSEITKLTSADLLSRQEPDREGTVPGRPLTGRRTLVGAHGQRLVCDVRSRTARRQGPGTEVWLTVFADVSDLHAETLRDELTGLRNRKGASQLLSRLLATETDRQLAVLFCDVDNFKRINDSLGHEVGDELLVTLARRLEHGLLAGCVAARLAGDEFLILCSDLEAAGGLQMLTETVSTLLSTTITPHGYQIAVSVSIGAALVDDGLQTPQDLLRVADTAMYRAKDGGGGRVVRADPAQTASLEQELQLEAQLRQALARDELILHYQPIVDQDGQVHSAEALLRWPHPERGLLSPAVILPAARRAGLLADLDRWVLRTAVHEAAQWPTPDGRAVGLAVNLGSQWLHAPDFSAALVDIVVGSELGWDRLILEISETDLLDLAPATEKAMQELVERGVRFAVDDFGTGYSSLERLKVLPVQVIKLDRTFVAGIEHDPVDTAIAGAALSIASARGATCIAEGVETTGQLYRLAALGYERHQGFLFAAGVPTPHLRTLISHPSALALTSHAAHVEARREPTRAAPPGAGSAAPRQQGEVTDASAAGHLCWAYEHPDEFHARAREYALDGLRAGQQIEYVGNAPTPQLRAQLAADDTLASALESGALSVSSVEDFYRLDDAGIVDPDAAVAARIAATQAALAAGYTGFRAVVDATAMARTRAHREAFAHFEYLIDHVMSAHPVTALCAYDVTTLDTPAIAELACLHPLTSPGASPFRLYAERPHNHSNSNRHTGHFAVAGTIDPPCTDLLVSALHHTEQHELVINDRGLDILDPRALLALDRHAREHHQHIVLRLTPPLTTRLTPLPELTHTRIETQPSATPQR